MRRLARFALLCGLALVSAPAQAALFIYDANLSGLNESPPVVTTGTGFTTVTYDDLAHTLRVEVDFSNLMGTTTAAHIHVRQDLATPNGGVATQLPSFVGFPPDVTSGTFDGLFDLTLASSWNPAFVTANGGLAGAEGALFASLNDGRAYLNVHSSFAPGGEIRGDLSLIPEPALWGMMILGFGLVGGAMRRRRQKMALRYTA